VRLRFVPEGDEDLGPLRDGAVDLDVGVIHDLGPEVRTEDLYEEELVGMVASGHPLASGRITLRRLSSTPHVTVSRRGRSHGALDDVLEERGLRRRVVAVVPTFTSAAHMILTSDLTGLLPARYAAQVALFSGARVFTVPAELPRLPIKSGWHIRHDTDPAHHWLRMQLRDVVA
jgi:DNA-binding transcriptional LysR family regulator